MGLWGAENSGVAVLPRAFGTRRQAGRSRLIAALRDRDELAVDEARTGLQVISRKLDSYGPPPGASPKQREEAANLWRTWHDSVRPPDLDGPDAFLN